MSRSRYIPKDEKIAALLIRLLPADIQSSFYDKKVPAAEILKLFEWDHYPKRFVDGGPNEWWNVRPLSSEEHKVKTRKDKGELAKSNRLLGITKQGPKKKIPSRPFPKHQKRLVCSQSSQSKRPFR